MSSYRKPVESREAEVRRAEEGSRVEIGHHTDRTKWTEGASGKMLYARTANGQDTLPENVQMWLSATTAGFLGKQQGEFITLFEFPLYDFPFLCHLSTPPVCQFVRHIAAECSSKTMCWNCKEAGHLASQCNNDPICHVCNRKGHLARECMESGDPRVCNNCFKPGHIAVDCTNEKACNNCRKPGHLARDCVNDPVCNLCNVSGHVARQCPKTAIASQIVSGPFHDIICRNCGQSGHISRECLSVIICNCCGGRGHVAHECPSARLYDRPYAGFESSVCGEVTICFLFANYV
ncbi:hypothetical protein Sango_2001100 [Sesamum angolense]|uniref:CCHC-type domain-containing protein n=1 Tax=Sesamum angolense TaxID=2727404 RepID=A0AAE1WF89_9LAMI|nr:hypothetical protein Sango_2001100 [Sesamum angolense]